MMSGDNDVEMINTILPTTNINPDNNRVGQIS